jgi:mRNA interferase RelE/StbE
MRKPQFAPLYPKIVDYVYPQLRHNPFFGQNIKKLRGEFSAFYRYRLGSFRLFYTIDADNTIVFVATVKDRKEAY